MSADAVHSPTTHWLGQRIDTPADVSAALRRSDYIADRATSTAMFLAHRLGMPLLIEGEPGVGKTEISRAIATAASRRLVRLQCYEGIDTAAAMYEWDYARQLLHLQSGTQTADSLFTERYLLERPLLEALRAGDQCVLLIDEVDRADEAFEAFLLEFLSDFQISVPELGTVRASSPPLVILTSNRTRDLHDALRRRCIYHWVDYPNIEREVEILRLKVPAVSDDLRRDVARTVTRLRDLDLFKAPGVSETIAWARALGALGCARLDVQVATDTLGAVLKDRDDLVRLSRNMADLLGEHA